jgi:nucleoside-diphosphate-sugar epimerase
MDSRSRQIGLDSLVSVDIRSWFLKQLHVNIPVLKIMGDNTMASLVQYAIENLPPELAPVLMKIETTQGLGNQRTTDNNSEDSPLERSPSERTTSISTTPPGTTGTAEIEISGMARNNLIDWSSESRPPANIINEIPDPGLQLVHSLPRVIVLTGCTGLLGRHLLTHILAQPTVERVFCLAVRSLADRLQQGKLLEDHRVTYYAGDLSHPLLGLSEEETETIFATADVVIHNGADTSHFKHYIDLRASNVGSTVALARLCLPRRIPMHYISSAGTGIFHSNSSTEGFHAAPIKTAPGKVPDGSFGYACSKWTCERFLERMAEEYGMRVFIHRPSTIVREGEDAEDPEAERDWINAFLAYVKKLKAVPMTKRMAGALDLVYVRSVCEGVGRYLFDNNGTVDQEGGITYVNEVGDEVIPLGKLQDLGLQEQGESYDIVPREKWMTAAISAGLHPGVAALIDGMEEGSEQYPKLLKGERFFPV